MWDRIDGIEGKVPFLIPYDPSGVNPEHRAKRNL